MTEETFKRNGSARYTVFPINYPTLWDFYQKHAGTIWFPAEVKLHDDIADWNNKLTNNEKSFLKNVLAFFAASDGIVNENIVQNFYNEVQIPEARQFYAMQMLIEAVHSEQYALLIDTYVSNTDEKSRLFNAIENIPAIKRKAQWAIKWIEEGSTLQQYIPQHYLETLKNIEENNGTLDDKAKEALNFITRKRPSLAQRLLAYVCVEGIFFSGAFCAIYWLKSRGLMPGLATANQFISRDENLHAEFAVELYKLLGQRLDTETVHAVFREAVDIEKEFITESLPVSLIGMNNNLMATYIEYVADRWLTLLGYPKIYKASNPFPFMELLSLNEKVNFFEGVNTQYSRSNVGTKEEDREIAFDADF